MPFHADIKLFYSPYSEGLGAFGENYVATKTIEFAKYFDNRQCFSERDLESWAGIVMLEMALDGEYEKSDSIVLAYNKTIVNNCVTCTPKQKETIKKLGANLLEKWHDFLINRGY